MRRSTSAVGWSTSDRLAGSVEDEDVLRAPETPEETGQGTGNVEKVGNYK